MWLTGYSEEVAKDMIVRRHNKRIGLASAQTPQKPRYPNVQMALLRDLRYILENFQVLNMQTNDTKPKNQNGYQNKRNNNNSKGGQRGQSVLKDKLVLIGRIEQLS